MRVIHFGLTSGTGHVVPLCGVWGSRDTDWNADGGGVTCVACRDAMRYGPHGEVPSTRGSGTVRRQAPGGSSFALRYAGIALVAWVGAWALLAAGGVLLPAAGSRATTVVLWITVAILVLSGVALAALAGRVAIEARRLGASVRATPPRGPLGRRRPPGGARVAAAVD